MRGWTNVFTAGSGPFTTRTDIECADPVVDPCVGARIGLPMLSCSLPIPWSQANGAIPRGRLASLSQIPSLGLVLELPRIPHDLHILCPRLLERRLSSI